MGLRFRGDFRKLDSELHGSQQGQRGPIESELNEYGHRGRVLAPVIGRYGGASSDLSLILDLVAREMARKHTAFYNIGFSEAKALFRQKLARKWGHAIARGWATLLLDRLRDFVVVPSSAGGNSSFELHSEHKGACHFGPLSSLPWTLGHVRLISFLGSVCAALLLISTS